jgi:hypothetical protein
MEIAQLSKIVAPYSFCQLGFLVFIPKMEMAQLSKIVAPYKNHQN